MLKGGVIMDVVTPEHAKSLKIGSLRVMALERVHLISGQPAEWLAWLI